MPSRLVRQGTTAAFCSIFMFNIHHLLGGAMCIGQRGVFQKPQVLKVFGTVGVGLCHHQNDASQDLMGSSCLFLPETLGYRQSLLYPSESSPTEEQGFSRFSFFCFNLNVSNICLKRFLFLWWIFSPAVGF